ncbi:hypothetical protein [Pseudidiomarina taiwanensis]|uniref:Lipoprotein n=1 Tax=Pseudidiomarina taiwanensis TaxID=337250 RepID=A0A432ZFX4_9GAMM|nr:hypothetical protein [Pseudidiomarina taiwanensis]RUO76809.1 hypothetical protein CWI83_07755 [Pseudidiomarina taiwanensis]
MRTIQKLALAFMVIAVAGCSSPGAVEMLGEKRPAITKADVIIMQVAPESAAPIARLRAEFSYGVRETDEDKLVYAIERVRTQAAALGANLIVIDNVKFRTTAAGLVTNGLFEGEVASQIAAQRTPVVTATAYYLNR